MSRVITHPKTGEAFWLNTSYVNDNKFHGAKRSNPSTCDNIVVHHTAGNTAGDLSVLRGKTNREVSVKYLVADPSDGQYRDAYGRLIIWQLLPDDVIGWSIGATTGTYGYVENSNSDSIEISNLGTASDAYEASQIAAVEALIALEEKRLNKNLAVFGHKEVAPGRKSDPSPYFPLERIKDFAEWLKAGEAPVTDTGLRVVVFETNSAAHRTTLINMLKENQAAHAVLGRSVVFHDALADVKEIEAYIAKYPNEIKRTNGIMVAAGTHTPLNNPLPNGKFDDTAAFPTGADCSALEARIKELEALVLELKEDRDGARAIILKVDDVVDSYLGE